MNDNSSIFFPLSTFTLNSTHYNFFAVPDYEITDEQNNKENQKHERNDRRNDP